MFDKRLPTIYLNVIPRTHILIQISLKLSATRVPALIRTVSNPIEQKLQNQSIPRSSEKSSSSRIIRARGRSSSVFRRSSSPKCKYLSRGFQVFAAQALISAAQALFLLARRSSSKIMFWGKELEQRPLKL